MSQPSIHIPEGGNTSLLSDVLAGTTPDDVVRTAQRLEQQLQKPVEEDPSVEKEESVLAKSDRVFSTSTTGSKDVSIALVQMNARIEELFDNQAAYSSRLEIESQSRNELAHSIRTVALSIDKIRADMTKMSADLARDADTSSNDLRGMINAIAQTLSEVRARIDNIGKSNIKETIEVATSEESINKPEGIDIAGPSTGKERDAEIAAEEAVALMLSNEPPRLIDAQLATMGKKDEPGASKEATPVKKLTPAAARRAAAKAAMLAAATT
jgi:hypothetical protein